MPTEEPYKYLFPFPHNIDLLWLELKQGHTAGSLWHETSHNGSQIGRKEIRMHMNIKGTFGEERGQLVLMCDG